MASSTSMNTMVNEPAYVPGLSLDANQETLTVNSPITVFDAVGDQAAPPQNTGTVTPSPMTHESSGGRDGNEFTLVTRRKKVRQRKSKQQKIRQLLSTKIAPSEPHFKKFYSVKFPREDIDNKLNVVAVERDIHKQILKPASIKKQNKDTLLIEVKSSAQGTKLKNVTNIANNAVVITEHKSLNQSKGTVYSEAMSNSSLDELYDALKDQHVVKIERMKFKINGTLKDSHRYVLTFDKPDIPDMIKLTEWHHELIELYIPKPLRCLNCQRLGHTKNWCKKEAPTCAKCAEEGHKAFDCTKELKSINCGEKHNAMSKDCPAFIFKSEVLATQTRKRLTFLEADAEVKQRYTEKGERYSFIVKKSASTERQTTSPARAATSTPSPSPTKSSNSEKGNWRGGRNC